MQAGQTIRQSSIWHISFVGIGIHNWLWGYRVHFSGCSSQWSWSWARCLANTEGLAGPGAQTDVQVAR